MLEPRIVAASTHGRDSVAQVDDGGTVLPGISSRGGFIPNSDAS
jgi:hypothetical protein